MSQDNKRTINMKYLVTFAQLQCDLQHALSYESAHSIWMSDQQHNTIIYNIWNNHLYLWINNKKQWKDLPITSCDAIFA